MLSAPPLCCKSAVKSPNLKDTSDAFRHLWRLGFLARRRRVACARGAIVGVAEEWHFTGAIACPTSSGWSSRKPNWKALKHIETQKQKYTGDKHRSCLSLELSGYALCKWYASKWFRAGVRNNLPQHPGRILITCQVWDLKQTRTARWLTKWIHTSPLCDVLFGSVSVMAHCKQCTASLSPLLCVSLERSLMRWRPIYPTRSAPFASQNSQSTPTIRGVDLAANLWGLVLRFEEPSRKLRRPWRPSLWLSPKLSQIPTKPGFFWYPNMGCAKF